VLGGGVGIKKEIIISMLGDGKVLREGIAEGEGCW
jgi:hypothetical protein